jgi:HD-GYP domain-containing protein (c-di-GMP phosphodiesterase class II)
MSDTQLLLTKISALRQRLEQAQGLAREADAAVAGLVQGNEPERLARLERQTAAGLDHCVLFDGVLRQFGDAPATNGETRAMPAQLTTRARRILERGREHLLALRSLADDPALAPAQTPAGNPLATLYRETAAMTDTTLRTVQAFPDAPSVQLRLSEGLEAILTVIDQRLVLLRALVERRRLEESRIETLADLLQGLHGGQALDVKPYVAMAEAILDEAAQSAPLQFLHAAAEQPARFIACHSLTVAQVVARVVRQDPDLRGRPLEPVLAALVHDVGMLSVPVEILTHPGTLNDVQRRAVEAHVRLGASLAGKLLPDGHWLTEAVAGHHERLDGTGYPDGLREFQLSALTRLLMVCDVYAAQCVPRPHRPARETRTALTDTLLLAEQGGLDRQHAERLLHLSFYPVGAAVELADGALGVVVASPGGRRDLTAPARPVLALLTDSRGKFLPFPRPLDLATADSRSIVRTLPPAERRQRLGGRYPEWA